MVITDFIFDGQALSDFGYFLVFENTEEVMDVSVMEYNLVKAALSDESRRVSHKYESNYTSTFTIMKNLCDNPDDTFLTKDDISELVRWLVRKQYKWFRFVDDEDEDEIWYKAQMQVAKEYIGANVVGLQVTLNTNAPYGFTKEYKFTADTQQFKTNIYSDEEGYIYPTVQIVCGGAGDLTLTNITEGRTTTIDNCTSGEIITIDGETLQITSNKPHDFTNDYNYLAPRFMNKYGEIENEFEITLMPDASTYNTVSCTLTHRGIRKVGLL